MKFRPAEQCRHDLVSLGECMLRLSPPGHGRLEFASQLEVWVGGAEYNVAYALARLGLRTAWVGGLVDHALSRLIRGHAGAAGVDTRHAVTLPYDGVGRDARLGLNFTEVGTGIRPSVTLYDRGHSATSALKPGDVDWEKLFGDEGVRWLHTGGVCTALGPSCAGLVAEAVACAHRHGTFVSYDLNFRSKLWSSEAAIAATRPLLPNLDALIGNEEDFQKVLGYTVPGVGEELRDLSLAGYREMARRVAADHPHLHLIGTTLREVVSGSRNHWSALLYSVQEQRFHEGPHFQDLEIEDRVGGGDGFASGLAYALLRGEPPSAAVRWATAHGALLQTTRGDTSQITAAELAHVVEGGSARIQR